MSIGVLSEAEKMSLVPGVVYVDGASGRRARLVGSGLDVWEVINAWRFLDGDFEELKGCFPAHDVELLRRALRFYELFPEEIDAKIADNEAVIEDLIRQGCYFDAR
jgi:hypothetical protein